jgi:hypothetical protein
MATKAVHFRGRHHGSRALHSHPITRRSVRCSTASLDGSNAQTSNSRISGGMDSAHGSRFVERTLPAVATRRQQAHNILHYSTSCEEYNTDGSSFVAERAD